MSDVRRNKDAVGAAVKPVMINREQVLYYLIAGVNVLTICAALYLTHSLSTVLSESIGTHDQWVKRSEGYERLSESIAEMDVPGNAVFESLTVVRAEEELNRDFTAYKLAMDDVQESTMGLRTFEQEKLILQDLKSVQHSVTEMVSISKIIFSDLRAGKRDDAIRIMAQLDRANGDAGKMVTMLRRHASLLEQSDLQHQQARADLFDKIAKWFSIFVLLIVSTVTTYSKVMAQRLQQSEKIIQNQQAQIQASSRMSALGEMAAGVAHEINNPLAIIKANSERLREQGESEVVSRDSVMKTAATIERTSLRIAKIVKGLRSFARAGDSDPFQEESVQRIIEETLDLCRTKIANAGTEIRLAIPETPIAISCRSTEISQIVLNLVSNASDAVSGLAGAWISIGVVDLGRSVEISVMDSGPGVPKHLREKIMNPFFTTKEVGRGTGLGLSISTGIAQAHGGTLSLDTSSSATRFVVTLPKETPKELREAKRTSVIPDGLKDISRGIAGDHSNVA